MAVNPESPDTVTSSAGAVRGGATISINRDMTMWRNGGDPLVRAWTAGHESLHSGPPGLHDYGVRSRVYKFGLPDQRVMFEIYRSGRMPGGENKPDILMDLVFPNLELTQ